MSGETVLARPDEARIRDELERLVVRDLHGPFDDEEEEFAERPMDRYILGRLAPDGELIEPDLMDDAADTGGADVGEDEAEPSVLTTASLMPSALGCTVFVDGDVTELKVTGHWARYQRVEGLDSVRGDRVWCRVPDSGSVRLALREGRLDPERMSSDEHVVVRGRARRHDGGWLVSVFLVNTTPRPQRLEGAAWLFQARIGVTAVDGGPIFRARPDTSGGGDEIDRVEQRRLAMAYRFHPEFAVGHGVGVTARQAPDDPTRAVRIETRAVPTYEIPYTDVPDPDGDPESADLVLDMEVLRSLPVDALRRGLSPLVTGYRAWIARQERRLSDSGEGLVRYGRAPSEVLATARRAADRIEAGIDLLTGDENVRDENALRAFRFANEAMYLQRVHTLAAAVRRKTPDRTLDEALEEVRVPKNHRWRPFQLAFILLNLPALADPGHAERGADERDGDAVADLLWFPTGGGKTEAYLGLTAFTLAIRRLSPALGGYDPSAGVAVLMRYTLRLLTIQQFQRATALICACEHLRRGDETTWGTTPFRIGLWVGARVTPNRTDDAGDWLKQLRKAGRRGFVRATGSPHQLTGCPWCGEVLEAGVNIVVDPARRRTQVFCPNLYCEFSNLVDPEGIPIVLVDEEIYRLLPSLIIATVDKFAQLPWRGETQALFGGVGQRCERHGYVTEDTRSNDWELSSASARHPAKGALPSARIVDVSRLRPPDLIIQDELHLISGPLGSLAGLYETAVDRLATWELPGGRRVRPKVVASTATVRRAQQQIGALFDRRTEVFPPPGLDIGDNFFSRQRPVDPAEPGHRPGRRYVGICAHGVRNKSVLIRVYVAVLGAAQTLHDRYGRNRVTDPYMTLVGYFNSLRDLGAMRRMVEDDVSTRLSRAEDRGFSRRWDPVVKELTSRLSSSDIPVVLDHLEQAFTDDREERRRRPIDILLATNMIAVGVDVSRLGVMVVSNQPKSAAEYIQATSRVGRAAPGLVFTVYNWARPRDLSHYETFEHFHATIYRHVEALSVTPFADRAVDRGLTGVLVSLVRNLGFTYNGNLRAGQFDRAGELADHVVRFLKRRAREVTADNRVGVEVERHLDARLDQWHNERRVPGRRLAYNKRAPGTPGDAAGLLRRPEDGSWLPMTCPTSLRDVEPGVRLLLLPEDDNLAITQEPPFVAGGSAS
ncbi:DISARM system helicase DrmA [Streptosporangium sp. NBC_01755]|uniref:DISARM system helicase DrmA n=1 Tax=Streptosporangium sp. NBC_01755 TaxID=2975949 RepID=UPI002DD8F335|nr:DISARM system helicase DrmA [Streptosporangium sp. NBC_01755]WSC98563.1 DISARM system helicase DrmA [Streptosporangium sp. NBC_01755]